MSALLGADAAIRASALEDPEMVTYDNGQGRWCQLVGVVPSDPRVPRGAQVEDWFRVTERLLDAAGFAPTDMVRTWFVLDRILEWYGEFNQARTRAFERQGMFARLPASTAVGGGNASGSALVGTVLAVQPYDERLRIAAVSSPEQGPAFDYRSAFSRALEVAWPGARRLYVSGTASIARDGRTLHAGDPAAQVEHTLDVAGALLAQQALGWSDGLLAIAYFRHERDAHLVDRLKRRGWRAPITVARAEICRDDLLFELELSAGLGPGGHVT